MIPLKLWLPDLACCRQNIEPHRLTGKIFRNKELGQILRYSVKLPSAVAPGLLMAVFAHDLILSLLQPQSRLCVTGIGNLFVDSGGKGTGGDDDAKVVSRSAWPLNMPETYGRQTHEVRNRYLVDLERDTRCRIHIAGN